MAALWLWDARVFGQAPPALRARPFRLTAEDRTWWAFQPLRPRRPSATLPGHAGHPIDRLLSARLQEKGLSMNPPATPREQVRRAWFDLLGLPPPPEEVERFERDPTDAAWAALVDRLLASPGYGERWGRHWLDLVRYAESNGYERDGPKPDAWRYRDYVIEAFNGDKPYDRFLREQLAGDEVAADLASQGGEGSRAWREAIIATGFYRLHVWDDEPDSTLAAEFDDLDDMLVTAGTAVLGLTVGCARCHDHKFDPISQADYYSLLAFLRSIDAYGRHHTGGGGRGTGRIQRFLVPESRLRAWESDRQTRARKIEVQLEAMPDEAERGRLQKELAELRALRPPFESALAVAEDGAQPKPTRVLARGDVQAPREAVEPAFPSVFGLPAPAIPAPVPGAASTGRRRVLADWVTDPRNPLTARVWVNRVWQHHFGLGLVPTPDDFGRTGMPPTHPELLDELASGFLEGGWRMKSVHRRIMTSRAYRMSSDASRPEALAADEANTLFWRQNLRRLEAEAIRDTLLSVAGTLDRRAGGPSVYPTLSAEVHGTQDAAGKGWADSPAADQCRRSVYLVVKRALKVPILECFDFANSTSGTGSRPLTTTAPQALMLLNDSFVRAQSAALADRLRREAGEASGAMLDRLYALAFQRLPRSSEQAAALGFLAEQEAALAGEGVPNPHLEALRSLCRAVLNTSELIHVE